MVSVLILLIAVVLLVSFVIFLINRRSDLINRNNHISTAFDNATQEITRISLQNLKLKRELTLQSQKCDVKIVLEMNTILEKISKIGYNNISKEEKDFLNKIV